MIEAVDSGFLAVNGGSLYYEVTGQGFPLVLVHSRWMHSGLWDEQAKVFSTHYRVVRYDVRGFGESRMDRVPYSDADDLLKLFDHLDVDQAYLVGLSMGAEIAVSFALAHPERVKALVLSGAGLEDYNWGDAFGEEWGRFSEAIQTEDYPGAINQVVKMWVDGPIRPASDAVRARTREMMRGHTFEHHKPLPLSDEATPATEAQTEHVPTSEREKYAALMIPALVMVGDKDWPEQVAMAEILASYLPDAEHKIIPDAAHIVNLEQPELFNKTMLEFLKRH
jgi:3-oxoadipate enol-lactonase